MKSASEKIFDHLEDLNIHDIEIDHDFYWNIPKKELYDSYNKPENLDIGQLSDDYKEILLIAGDKEPISFALVWLASIYRALGEQVVK